MEGMFKDLERYFYTEDGQKATYVMAFPIPCFNILLETFVFDPSWIPSK